MSKFKKAVVAFATILGLGYVAVLAYELSRLDGDGQAFLFVTDYSFGANVIAMPMADFQKAWIWDLYGESKARREQVRSGSVFITVMNAIDMSKVDNEFRVDRDRALAVARDMFCLTVQDKEKLERYSVYTANETLQEFIQSFEAGRLECAKNQDHTKN